MMKHHFSIKGVMNIIEYDLGPCPKGEVLDKSRCGIYSLDDKYIVLNNGENYLLHLDKYGSWKLADAYCNGLMLIQPTDLFSSYEEARLALESSNVDDINFYRSYANNTRKLWDYDYQPSPPQERQVLYCREGDFTITLPKGTFSDQFLQKKA